ncbi:MAG: non-canonical purine NTP diphosphatase [Bacteroidia bacterium]|nr:non-canonical purine NTP diphosphatase [Bacteroidales bacterium]MDD3960975.1 non-canonical purine NTP diphosphatase [Bacteroidales bacterium]NCD41867.1 non-canonical purine NTP diphosphatase [Bacteroidia bacterium]
MNGVKLVFVTHNIHKVKEVSAMVPPGIALTSLADLGFYDEIIEDGQTLEENARIKSRTLHKKYGVNCFADDTGLEVEALNGAPGIHSARYAGEGHDFEANLQRLLHEMAGVTHRSARFRTVIALILNNHEYLFEGIVEGEIILERKGIAGFGYDPVFVPEGYNQTFSEMDSLLKNRISHRGIAFRKLCDFLANR